MNINDFFYKMRLKISHVEEPRVSKKEASLRDPNC